MATFEDIRAHFVRRPFRPFVLRLKDGHELYVDFFAQGVASTKNVVVNDYRKKIDRLLRYDQITAVIEQPESYQTPAYPD